LFIDICVDSIRKIDINEGKRGKRGKRGKEGEREGEEKRKESLDTSKLRAFQFFLQ
jgi:hypothetical protein